MILISMLIDVFVFAFFTFSADVDYGFMLMGRLIWCKFDVDVDF